MVCRAGTREEKGGRRAWPRAAPPSRRNRPAVSWNGRRPRCVGRYVRGRVHECAIARTGAERRISGDGGRCRARAGCACRDRGRDGVGGRRGGCGPSVYAACSSLEAARSAPCVIRGFPAPPVSTNIHRSPATASDPGVRRPPAKPRSRSVARCGRRAWPKRRRDRRRQ